MWNIEACVCQAKYDQRFDVQGAFDHNIELKSKRYCALLSEYGLLTIKINIQYHNILYST